MKLLTPDEFNNLQLPSQTNGRILEACRYIFILNMSLNRAAKTCELTDSEGMLNLLNTMNHIIRQIVD